MKRKYPSHVKYNLALVRFGGDSFKSLRGIQFIPRSISPIKVYQWGAGTFAVVFNGLYCGANYAIRCFLNEGEATVPRYREISNYFRGINEGWKVNFEFLDDEIRVENEFYPVIKMDWLGGAIKINEFVSKNISNINVLNSLQAKLVELSVSLERNKIGHGDLQSGNILVVEKGLDFDLKLVDYDGVYIPAFKGQKSLENGRSEFQHPRRNNNYFNETIDRFSIWVMLTAIEAIKIDKSLWLQVMQGGHNSLDNFLFVGDDFSNPSRSQLFKRLLALNSPNLNQYCLKLMQFCSTSIEQVESPILLRIENDFTNTQKDNKNVDLPSKNETDLNDLTSNVPPGIIRIISPNCPAKVLTPTFSFIGNTPLDLKMETYLNKMVIVSSDKGNRKLYLNNFHNVILVDFSK